MQQQDMPLQVNSKWENIFCVLLYLLQVLVSTSAWTEDMCLEPKDLSTQVTLTKVTIQDLQNYTLPSVTELRVLDSNLTFIPNDTLQNLSHLKVLILRNNSIASIAPDAFSTTSSLEILDLGSNLLTEIPETLFKPLTQLKRLYLDNNRLSSAQGSLHHLTNLLFLDLSDNRMPNVVEEVAVLENLVTLVVQNTGIFTLAGSSLALLPNLCELDLTNNKLATDHLILLLKEMQLKSLRILKLGYQEADNTQPTGSVKNFSASLSMPLIGLSNLTYLDLSRSQISVCDQNILGRYPYLKTLMLSLNNLNTIPECIQNSSVERLNLSFNEIRTWKTDMFFPNLTHLTLDRNLIIRLTNPESFRPYPNLRSLSINQNSMVELGSYVFQHLQHLEYLDLSQNSLEQLVNYTFQGLQALQTLQLYSNNIKIFHNNRPFEKLYNMTSLIFHHNSLCEIWPWVLPDQVNLQYLDFSQNKIEGWNEYAFTSNKKLGVVLLNDNEIRKFTNFMLEELSKPQFQFVNLTGNDFDCSDCSMQNLIQWFDLMNKRSSNVDNRDVYQYISCQNGAEKPYTMNYTLLNVHDHCEENAAASRNNLLVLSITLLVAALLLIIGCVVLFRLRWQAKYYWYLWFGNCCYQVRPRKKSSHVYDAYISYSETDRVWLQNTFLPSLENTNTNFHFYVLERDFEPGRYIIENILEGMEKSNCFVAVLSKDYLQNNWRVWEFNWAVCRLVSRTSAQRPSVLVLNLGNVKENEMTSTMRSVVHTQAHFKWPQEGSKQKQLWEKLYLILAKQCNNNNNNAQEDQNTRL